MRKGSFGLFLILAAIAIVCLPAVSLAQKSLPTRDRFVISARAGGVNAVTGRASVRTHGNTEWELLTIKEDLESGDCVKTGTDGRVEMLLNPGSYLRLGENSEFELANSSLDNLEIRLLRGTAVVEATGADDSQLQINISTPHAKLAIVRRGLYRLNVVPGDNTELIVRKGRVMLDKTKITGGNKVVFSSDTFLVAKLQQVEKKYVDGLDTWSKERSETVAEANRKIRQREMSALMVGLRDRWFNSASTASGGFWYFSSRYSCYTFVPYFMGWGSPYGSSYSSAFFPGYYCGGCRQGFDYRNNYPTGSTSIAGGSGGGTTSAPSMPISRPSAPMEGGSRSRAMESRIDRHQQVGRPNN